MNFNPDVSPWNMPELNWKYGYLFFWLLMAGIGGALALFFRRRGWLGSPKGEGRDEH
jgi:magnesium transporter